MKHVRTYSSQVTRALVTLSLLGCPAAAAQGNGNASAINVPTLDVIGLASLAGVLAMAGAWKVSRGNKK